MNNEVFFESVVLHNNQLSKNIFQGRRVHYWSLKLSEYTKNIFLYKPNFYYKTNFNCTTDSNIKINLSENNELRSFLSKNDLIDNNQKEVCLELIYDFEITEFMSEKVNNNFSSIKRIERLYYNLLKVSEENNNDDDFNKWLSQKNDLGKELKKYIKEEDYNISKTFNKILPSFEYYEWDKYNFKESLLKILNSKEDKQIVENYNKILEMRGIGRTSLSKILNYIDPINFPIFSTKLFEYFDFLGYETGKESGQESKKINNQGLQYNNYRKNLLRIIDSINVFINQGNKKDEFKYNKINYFIRKKMKIVDII